ncbi:MAG: tetratricopeptide repeat protein [Rhodospirillaceae bacterium]
MSDDLFAKAQAKYLAGELADAADLYQRVLDIDSTHPNAAHMLGVIAYQLGQLDAAATLLNHATTLLSPFPEAETHYGIVLMALGRLEEAEAALRKAYYNNPDNSAILFNLGNVYLEKGDSDNATATYEKVVTLDPDHAEAWCQLGILYSRTQNLACALEAFEKAIASNPKFSQALYNLANVYRDLDRFGDAEETLRKAIAVRPEYAMAWNSLGTLLGDMGRSIETLEALDQAILFAPESQPYASNRLCSLQYISNITNEKLADAHAEWYWLHVATEIKKRQSPYRDKVPNRPLKLGFISPDFGFHPVGFLSAPLFEHLDEADIATTIFSTRPSDLDDALSNRIRLACNNWVAVSDLDDAALAALIDDHTIDILIDMSGQTSGNRLGVFARNPSPIQMSWIGYVGTTGLPTMDYIISDQYQSPDGYDSHYTETVLRLPEGYSCYAPLAEAPDVTPLPAIRNNHITFGCLNYPGKLNTDVIQNFSSVLAAVPNSRLLFRFRGLDDPAVQLPITKVFESFGINRDRLIFEGRASHVEFLSTYNRIDIALDTTPYSGGLTTCEALWMGVPTLTCPGTTFAGRHAMSHLCTAGYGDLVADSSSNLIEIAVSLSADLEGLALLRARMREQVASSPLCDGPRFAKDFAAAMRVAWNSWCSVN